jgi:hypothetical protein
VVDPEGYSEFITEDEYTRLANKVTCGGCGESISKPKWPK